MPIGRETWQMQSHPKGTSFGAYRLASGEHFVKKYFAELSRNVLSVKPVTST